MPDEAGAEAARSEGARAETERARPRVPRAALALAVAALLSSWNPFAAPFGLLVGVAGVVYAWRALGDGRVSRGWARAALVGAALAALASAAVVAISAGTLLDARPGEPVVAPRPPGQASEILDAAEQRTREARERAHRELGPATPRNDSGR
jgi:hypothetical protein